MLFHLVQLSDPIPAGQISSTSVSVGYSIPTKPTRYMSHPQPPRNPTDVPDGKVSSTLANPARTSGDAVNRSALSRGEISPSRYPAKDGWFRRDTFRSSINGPNELPCLSRRNASMVAKYQYSGNDKSNKLPDGFRIPAEYARAISEALCDDLDKCLSKPYIIAKLKGVLQLVDHNSWPLRTKKWQWRINADRDKKTKPAPKPGLAWKFVKQQIGGPGVRRAIADYIESMSEIPMPDGKCNGNCVVLNFAKFPPKNNTAEQPVAETSASSVPTTDEFKDLDAYIESSIFDVTLEAIEK